MMNSLIDRAIRRASSIPHDPGRRDFLSKVTMTATALMFAPVQYVMRPIDAYAAVCGPATGCNDGYTAFCCSINRGINNCPPGPHRRWLVESFRIQLLPGQWPAIEPLLPRLPSNVLMYHRMWELLQFGLHLLQLPLPEHRNLRPETCLLRQIPIRAMQHEHLMHRTGDLPGGHLRSALSADGHLWIDSPE